MRSETTVEGLSGERHETWIERERNGEHGQQIEGTGDF